MKKLFNAIRNSLRLKYVLASVLVELVVLALLIGNSLRIITTTIEQESTGRTESVTQLLDSALGYLLIERDYSTTSDVLQKLLQGRNSEIVYIKIFDDQGRLFAEIDRRIGETAGTGIDDAQYILPTSVALTLDQEAIGYLEYGLSLQSLHESKQRLFEQGLLISALAIVATLLMFWGVSLYLSRHISELMRGATNISAGLYDARIPVHSLDEAGRLAQDFNSMAQAIQDRVAEITRTSEALSIKSAEFEAMFGSIADGVLFIDSNRSCKSVNAAFTNLMGYATEELLGHQLDFLYENPTEFETRGKLNFSEDSPDTNESYELNLKRKDGSLFTAEITTSRVRGADQGELGYIAVVRDISVRKQYEDDLMESREKALVTLESIGDAVITTDELGLVQYLNPIAEELTGWDKLEATGKRLPEVFDIYNEKTNEPLENPVTRCLRENVIIGPAHHTVLVDRNGKSFAIEDSAAPIRDRLGKIIGVILVFHDVSMARRLTAKLNWQASHDVLTGLFNRVEFERRLEKILKLDDESSQHALLYMDLDQFKVVNDTSGHVAGDELLKQLAQLFQQHKRENDVLARLGGDEFGMLLENCPAEKAVKIAEKITQELNQFRFLWMGKVFTAGASIGLVPFAISHKQTITTLMSAADVACYAAKDAGRNRIHLYRPDDDNLVQRHGEMEWVNKIQHALEQDSFELYCQPIVGVMENSQQPTHYEILLRMLDADGQVVMPLTFLPAAERYNLMPDIDRWVINTTLTYLPRLKLTARSVLAINLSGASLSDDKFLEFVVKKLTGSALNMKQICFEITETAAISNLARVTRFIADLQKLGCQFSLDDFGSGLSSFTYLKNLNVNYLKIDGSFVQDMHEDPVDRCMVEAINQIGHVMSIKTIAEYVEDQQTLDILQKINVDYYQGFYYAKPFPLNDLERQLADKETSPDGAYSAG